LFGNFKIAGKKITLGHLIQKKDFKAIFTVLEMFTPVCQIVMKITKSKHIARGNVTGYL
jgi:hypothetical protein